MRHLLPLWIGVLSIIACNQNPNMSNQTFQWPEGIKPPVATQKPFEVGRHGDTRIDEYYWMNDYFKKGPDSSHVVAYLEEENAYLDTMMSGVRTFRTRLFDEMKKRIKEKDESVPVYYNGYYYFTRYEEGKQYFVYCRKKGSLEAPEEVLLDVNEMAKGHSYFSVTGYNVSPDNKLLAYGVDTVSRRQYTIYIKNLETGQVYPETLYPSSGPSAWANDNKTLFYTATNPETLLTEKIVRHSLGTDAKSDVVVYRETDPSNYIGIDKTKSNQYFLIVSAGTLSSEVRVLSADHPFDEFKVFQPRMKEVLYSVDHWEGKFFIVTNKDAKNFRLMETPVAATGSANWKEVIPHRADVLLEGIEVFKQHIVITERKEGLIRLRIRKLSDDSEHYLDFGEPAYLAYVSTNPDFNAPVLRYNYTSLTTPNSVYDYHMDTRDRKLMKQQEVVGGYNPKEYVTERLYAPGRDGVKIPVSIVYKKGMVKDGKSPLLLYAYGSYGISTDATFNSNRLSLLNRGFTFAIAHIRGGQEMGRQWYEDGKLFKKQNTFNDFIDCAEFLIKEKYTSKEHLYANGGSAGGLLMGAIVTQRPDLWHGVIAAVPFVDVVTTMLDETIPLTTNEFDEWGNPANKDAYAYMKGYSPYDNVKGQNYPHLLVTTGLHDSQVQYFEPAKWVARMRARKTGNNLLLLHTNMDAGHGGASGRFDYLKDVALNYSFLLALENKVE